VFASLAVRTQLDIGYLGLFVRKVVRIDLELVLDLRQPPLESRVLSVSEYRWVWNLSRLSSCSNISSRLWCSFALRMLA
jgi:hypothetical protein